MKAKSRQIEMKTFTSICRLFISYEDLFPLRSFLFGFLFGLRAFSRDKRLKGSGVARYEIIPVKEKHHLFLHIQDI